tara:strand:- start:701 stop:934 length:234 start_codon:yes stop_codon:yes gene_type:complete
MPQDPWETHNEGTNGWDQYKRLVINELERTNNRLDSMDKRLAKIEKNIVVLQTKAAMYAAGIAVIISGGVSLLTQIL